MSKKTSIGLIVNEEKSQWPVEVVARDRLSSDRSRVRSWESRLVWSIWRHDS